MAGCYLYCNNVYILNHQDGHLQIKCSLCGQADCDFFVFINNHAELRLFDVFNETPYTQ